ncbi:uncharacterized protein LOC131219360 isoform X2 [Magnolia sinica]|uniref:uncharacterized protein LOC131219360 isoform X2 n=1 Tax=Magnolia sinica TaxID=86752 RepID=UPI00265B5065|nr:uncharacterized protein LOC131219360 isoform X2 [Magnolia sinica]
MELNTLSLSLSPSLQRPFRGCKNPNAEKWRFSENIRRKRKISGHSEAGDRTEIRNPSSEPLDQTIEPRSSYLGGMSMRIKAVVDKFVKELQEALDADIQDRIMKEREMQSYIEEREREVAEREAAWKAELSRRENLFHFTG